MYNRQILTEILKITG